MSKNIRVSALLYITTLFIRWTHSYVLLAANLEDFKKVAKKFVPEKLALQIAEIATASSMNGESLHYNEPEMEPARAREAPSIGPPVDERELDQDDGEVQKEEDTYLLENDRQSSENENTGLKQLDFEDLVQQVKKRIENDLLKKQVHSNSQQRVKYSDIEPEDSDKRVLDTTEPEQIFHAPKHHDQNRYREVKHPKRIPTKNRFPPHTIPKVRKPPQKYTNTKYSDEKYPDEKYPDKNYQQPKTPNKEDAYTDQENDAPKTKEYIHDQKQNHGKFEKERNEEQENIHNDDEIDQNGKVVHNHHQYFNQQRNKYKHSEIQIRTVSPNPHGRYKENKGSTIEDGDPILYTKNMLHNDSYEDYATPKKSENVYASSVEIKETNFKEKAEHTNTKAKEMDAIPLAAKVTIDYDEVEKNNYYNDDMDNLKAMTEHLGYDYDATQQHSVQNSEIEKNRVQTTPMNKDATVKSKNAKKHKATMIPKRDFYKISSPNYYAKIPIVAEKYDFNEPIPEKDREMEDTKYFPMMPSAINGKVRI